MVKFQSFVEHIKRQKIFKLKVTIHVLSVKCVDNNHSWFNFKAFWNKNRQKNSELKRFYPCTVSLIRSAEEIIVQFQSFVE